MTNQLLLTRGLPGSGKTTWARTWVAESPEDRVRVNRDACAITLPGIHSDRHDAHAAGDAHLADKHGRRV